MKVNISYEFIRSNIEISHTILEGLEYVKDQIEGDNIEPTTKVVYDMIDGFLIFQKNMSGVIKMMPENKVAEYTDVMNIGFESLVTAYEEVNIEEIHKVLNGSLVENCNLWIKEIERVFKEALVS